jgi:hypothetical protein
MAKFYTLPSLEKQLFNADIELLPTVSESFELELAMMEYSVLKTDGYLRRTAFAKSLNGNPSLHYLLYSPSPSALLEDRTNSVRDYFSEGQFSTGYATNGLFPYRGKFHPQLGKALINIMGLKIGDVILDPMAGSGTTNVEAGLLGINSVAIDVSPFCRFMIRVKHASLRIQPEQLRAIPLDAERLFELFAQGNVLNRLSTIGDLQKKEVYELAFLAFLDALGYSKRVKTSDHRRLFDKVLRRYIDTVFNFTSNPFYRELSIGDLSVLDTSEAMNIAIDDNSVDGIITSPPYSFAIDYAENDRDQLEFLGFDPTNLKTKLIGLKGKGRSEKLERYFEDMNVVCGEIARVLKPNRYFTMIIGSNTNQTGGIRLEEAIMNTCSSHKLHLRKSMRKPIRGLRNTMSDEYILIFEKLGN